MTSDPERNSPVRRAPVVPLLAVLAAAALAAGGCGYALVGRATNVPEDVRQVYVQPLENRTARSQADQFLTRAIADELVTRQRFAVLSSGEGADAIISGAVTAFAVTPVAFDTEGRATEYEIVITASMRFRRPGDDGEVLWQNDRYVFRQSYPITVSETEYIDLGDQALQEAAERFAETMVSDLLEGF
jgi:outer membrane lipopolysaccharide assembly protein LptE/RlpB